MLIEEGLNKLGLFILRKLILEAFEKPISKAIYGISQLKQNGLDKTVFNLLQWPQ